MPAAQQDTEPAALFQNVRIFDGESAKRSVLWNVPITGNKIEILSTNAIPAKGAVINCGGRTLMPGLIDAHWRFFFAAPPLQEGLTGYLNLLARRQGFDPPFPTDAADTRRIGSDLRNTTYG